VNLDNEELNNLYFSAIIITAIIEEETNRAYVGTKFWLDILKRKDNSEDASVDWTIILKCVVSRVWTGVTWPSVGISGGSL
jgi:hypothetical protein